MQISLRDLSKAIRGMIVTSSDLDSMHTAFLNNQVCFRFHISLVYERVRMCMNMSDVKIALSPSTPPPPPHYPQVPSIWLKDSFASLKSLGSWVADLTFRVKFFRSWLTKGSPSAFPLPVFFFPQGFMTASLQTYARDHLEAIDNLSFAYQILSTPPQDIKDAPADGVIVYGLYLEVSTYVRIGSQ
jgi:dynein heavy chain, axonemal